jgi:hypothetical protein
LAKSHGGLDFFDARLSEARAKSANDQATAKVPFSRIQSDGPSLAPPTDNTARGQRHVKSRLALF